MKFFASQISDNISETPEGYLVCHGVAMARTGEMLYGVGETPLDVDENGQIIITREADEVFRVDTMASFEGKPITILHPANFVSPENWSTLAKGVIQNVRRGKGEQENDLVADLLITDSVAINLVKSGLREVSCGYEAEYIQSGVGRGIQKNIIGNHIALVSEGRAGSAYAINDHKGKGSKMLLKDKIKAIFAKAQDEALVVADAANVETPEAKTGFVSADDFNAAMKGVNDKFDLLAGKKKEEGDASTQPTQGAPAEVVAKDEEGAGEQSLADRLSKLEAAVAQLLESKAGDAASEEGGEGDVEDADYEESEDAEEDKEDKSGKTGDSVEDDTASRIEILAPGLKPGKDAKTKALIAAYATTDGKAVIHQFTGGKAPNFKDASLVDAIFVGASEVLKVKRNSELAGSKTHDFKSNLGQPKGAVTAEDVNAKNALHYAPKQ